MAAVGILFGAFPLLEGELLAGCYPAVVGALVGVDPGHRRRAAAQPTRPTSGSAPAGTASWSIGSALAALGWGALLAALFQGVPLQADGHVAGVTHLATPFAAAAGLAMVALVAVHGATFLTLRLPAEAAAVVGRTGPPAGAGGAHRGRPGHRRGPALRPGTRRRAAAGGGRTPAGAARGGAAGGPRGAGPAAAGVAFAATGAALALPVVLVGAALWPYVLVSTTDPDASLTVADAAASAPTLRLLGWVALPLLPALLGFQAMCWWVFRGRTDGRAPVYW